MTEANSSLIAGLDPQALFGLSADEAFAGEWEPPSLDEVSGLFPQWRVIRLLGRGGMGAVYEMHQPEIERTVAVKLLPIEASLDEHLTERFRREARTLAKLRHPGIVALFEFGITSAGHCYFVMEYVDGSPLSQWIAEGRLNVSKAIEVVCQVCEALAYAHAQGVVHRDIKPSNILLDAQGHVKVADFGLARLDHGESNSGDLSMSRTGQFMGTPAYAAPEQVEDAAHVDHRADIYALGVLLYEMLTGDLPRGVFQPPSRKSSGAEHLDDVVRRAMQERPEDRYQEAAELQRDISRPGSKKRGWALVLSMLAIMAIFPVLIVLGAFGGGNGAADGADGTSMPETRHRTPNDSILPSQPAPKMSDPPQTPTPTPILPAPVLSTQQVVHAWSLDTVSPALQPPVDLTKRRWKDAVLTSTGGAALLDDGTIWIWHESRPDTTQQALANAQSLGNCGDRVLALDANGRLIDVESGKMIMQSCRAVFASAKSGIVPVMTTKDEAVLLEIESHKRTLIPRADFAQMVLDSQGIVWCVLKSGELQKLEASTWIATPLQGMAAAANLAVGTGFMVLVESAGRCVIFGDGVVDSPQRFRLPTGTHNLRVGPQGRMVAW